MFLIINLNHFTKKSLKIWIFFSTLEKEKKRKKSSIFFFNLFFLCWYNFQFLFNFLLSKLKLKWIRFKFYYNKIILKFFWKLWISNFRVLWIFDKSGIFWWITRFFCHKITGKFSNNYCLWFESKYYKQWESLILNCIIS